MTGSKIVSQRERPTVDASDPFGVTAVVATHRGEAYLGEQLESILRQSRPVDEVIVTDDASPDGTVDLAVRVLEASSTPYRVFTRNLPLRIAGNVAFGIAEASTPVIALADQDDVWHDDKLARLVPEFDDPEVMLVHSDARLVDAAGDELEPSLFGALEISDTEWSDYLGDEQFGVLLRRNLVTGATTLVRRELAVRAGNAPAPWIHDEWFAIIAALTGGIRTVRAPLIDYRQHGKNQIGAVTPSLRDKLARVTGPGYAEQLRRVARMEALEPRLRELNASEEQRVEVLRKLAHERRRLAMPDVRLLRLAAIARGARRGDYARYSSRGRLDLIRDLLHARTDRPAS